MTRSKKLVLNSITSLLYQLLTFVCGFILPRLFLETYGSAINGLVSSITQFLSFITFCEMGVGAVIQSSLYKPLAEKDTTKVSRIILSSERFFRKIAIVLTIYTCALMLIYPFLIGEFEYLFTMSLILTMAISTFAQYYFGMTYRLVLTADQLGFICFGVNGASLLLNTVMCVGLIKIGATIHVVKLFTSIIFLIQPICISAIAKKKYQVDRKMKLIDEPIEQKWNGVAQHIAYVVLNNTDMVVLTLFSTLENVSIYSVYNLVVNGVRQIIISLTNGMQAFMGNMIAENERNTLNQTFEFLEWIIHTGTTIIFSITAFLIIPFISIYTADITDVNYVIPKFAYLITLAQAAYCLRLPYNTVILAAGHYKQTQNSAIIEATINIVLSVVVVSRWGLVGVAIGTLIAMLYRTCYLAWYLRDNIIRRRFKNFLNHIFVDMISILLFVVVFYFMKNFFTLYSLSYVSWLLLAIKTGIACVVISVIVNFIFYRPLMVKGVDFIKDYIRRIKK